MKLRKNWVWIAGLAVLAIGCAKSDDTAPATTTNGTTGTTPPATSTTGTTPPATTASYTAVQDIFTKNCIGCHGAANPKQGIDLSTYAGMMKGGSEGTVITAGDPEHSKLVDALYGRNGMKQMPMKASPLPADQIKLIEDWIKAGAKQS